MMAMIKLWKSETLRALGWKLLLQIHDEVILEGPKESLDQVSECLSATAGEGACVRVLSLLLDLQELMLKRISSECAAVLFAVLSCQKNAGFARSMLQLAHLLVMMRRPWRKCASAWRTHSMMCCRGFGVRACRFQSDRN
jgi:hypothetical protein